MSEPEIKVDGAPAGEKRKIVTNASKLKERYLKFGGIIVGGIVFIYIMMKIISPTAPPKQLSDKVDEKNAKKVLEAFHTNQNLPEEVWVEKGERRLDHVETATNDILGRMQKLETAVQAERDSKTAQGLTGGNSIPPGIGPPPDTRTKVINSLMPSGQNPKLPPGNEFPGYEKGTPTAIPSSNGIPGGMNDANFINEGLGIRVIANESNALGMIGEKALGKLDKEAQNKENGDKNVNEWMPSGSFMSGILLSGLDAPTGGQSQSNPHPVLIRVTDTATLPNRFRENTQECFILGAGYGDISSERAYIRTESFSCVMKNGRTIDLAVKGYVAGEDGKNGMRGRLVSKEGQMIAKALLAGFASGIGQAFQASTMTQSISPLGTTQTVNPNDALKAGAYSGVASSMNMLAAHYIKMAEQTFPIIEIDAGRKINVVMTKGFNVSFDPGMDQEEKEK